MDGFEVCSYRRGKIISWGQWNRLFCMTNSRDLELEIIRNERFRLQQAADMLLVKSIDYVPIGTPELLPFGWRKAAKGRTVWRIAEEVVTQFLEANSAIAGFENYSPADSEVAVFDFSFNFPGFGTSFVNVKTAVKGARNSKDDVSKAIGLREHFNKYPNSRFYIATFVIEFTNDPGFRFVDCIVMPLNWLPDIYVNPSNNGNVQSSKAKQLDSAVEKSLEELLLDLDEAIETAQVKRRAKDSKERA